MQIYTYFGDKGKTMIIGGETVWKDDLRVEAYGSIDELNSMIGHLLTYDEVQSKEPFKQDLSTIQQLLFDCGTDLATPHGKREYRLTSDAVLWLESRIDEYADIPPALRNFLIPGGTQAASYAHVARTVARRCERVITSFQRENATNEAVLTCVNRLSDFLFTIARILNYDANVEEPLYNNGGTVFNTELKKENLKKEEK